MMDKNHLEINNDFSKTFNGTLKALVKKLESDIVTHMQFGSNRFSIDEIGERKNEYACTKTPVGNGHLNNIRISGTCTTEQLRRDTIRLTTKVEFTNASNVVHTHEITTQGAKEEVENAIERLVQEIFNKISTLFMVT